MLTMVSFTTSTFSMYVTVFLFLYICPRGWKGNGGWRLLAIVGEESTNAFHSEYCTFPTGHVLAELGVFKLMTRVQSSLP